MPLMRHLSDRQKWAYLLRSFRGRADATRLHCPSCAHTSHQVVKRKSLVTALVRCGACGLLYRTPTDPPSFAEDFYQEEYDGDFATILPSDAELQRLKATAFAGSPLDYAPQVQWLKALKVPAGARVLEYGASWGYGVWQMREAGYDAIGFEVSRPRARAGSAKLGVTILDDPAQIPGDCDVFISRHVLEHVPSPQQAIQLAKSVLRDDGLFIAATPNGCMARCEADARTYHRAWGMVHPQLLDDVFYERCFADNPYLLATVPFKLDALASWSRDSQVRLSLSSAELVCITAPNVQIHLGTAEPTVSASSL